MCSDFHEVKHKVKIAINELIKNDHYILKNNSNELTISSALHYYLKEQFKEYDVDCEYNRRQKEDPKKLNVSREADKKNSFVKPDIIVHSRSSTENNYLVIEVKKTNNSIKEILFDEKKLGEFTSNSDKDDPLMEYNYSFGLSVIFCSKKEKRLDYPSLKWFINGEMVESENPM